MATAQFIPLGGTLDPKGELPPLGSSSYLLTVGDAGLLIDFGVHPDISSLKETKSPLTLKYEEIGGEKLPIFPDLASIFERDETFFLRGYGSRYLPRHEPLTGIRSLYVVATHGHIDHVGALPYLKRKHPYAQIVMTEPTLEISSWIWEDNIRLTRSQKGKMLFKATDIKNLLRNVTLVEPHESLTAGPFTLRFFPAGHILGAVGFIVTVHGRKPFKVFVSGDLSFVHQHTADGLSLKELVRLGPVDYVIAESTYGGRTALPRKTIEQNLVDDVEACLMGGGKVLFGARSVGHSQEIFALLELSGIASRYPVYLDGSAQEISKIYSRHLALTPHVESHFIENDSLREDITRSEKPLVVIAPSGSFGGGRVIHYTLHWAESPRNFIVVTSYQRPSSPGYELLKIKRGDRVLFGGPERGAPLAVNALVKNYPLASHLDGVELLELLSGMRPERAFLVHGEEQRMEKVIAELGPWATKTFIGESYPL